MVIYKITNKINSKLYIGQTSQKLMARWKEHVRSKTCKALGAAIRKYGPNSFTIEILQNCSSYEEMNILEKEYIKKFSSLYPDGYNLTTGGNNGKHLEWTKKKIGEANRHRKHTEESKRKLSLARKGICLRKSPISDQERAAISARVTVQWKNTSLEYIHMYKTGTKIYVPELNASFFSPSCLVKFLGISRKRAVSAILGSCNRGYKYLKKYTIIRLDWSEEQKQEHIQKCNISHSAKGRRACGQPVLHKNTGKTYLGIAEAERRLGYPENAIKKALLRGHGKYKEQYFERIPR